MKILQIFVNKFCVYGPYVFINTLWFEESESSNCNFPRSNYKSNLQPCYNNAMQQQQ